jgi:hypothetical protein
VTVNSVPKVLPLMQGIIPERNLMPIWSLS